jgi:hypothetical protein
VLVKGLMSLALAWLIRVVRRFVMVGWGTKVKENLEIRRKAEVGDKNWSTRFFCESNDLVMGGVEYLQTEMGGEMPETER